MPKKHKSRHNTALETALISLAAGQGEAGSDCDGFVLLELEPRPGHSDGWTDLGVESVQADIESDGFILVRFEPQPGISNQTAAAGTGHLATRTATFSSAGNNFHYTRPITDMHLWQTVDELSHPMPMPMFAGFDGVFYLTRQVNSPLPAGSPSTHGTAARAPLAQDITAATTPPNDQRCSELALAPESFVAHFPGLSAVPEGREEQPLEVAENPSTDGNPAPDDCVPVDEEPGFSSWTAYDASIALAAAGYLLWDGQAPGCDWNARLQLAFDIFG